jgi:hypothetical protein
MEALLEEIKAASSSNGYVCKPAEQFRHALRNAAPHECVLIPDGLDSADMAQIIKEIDAENAGIGDVNSDARGSGARFNNGKPPVELIPVSVIAQAASSVATRDGAEDFVWEALRVLEVLGRWQCRDVDAADILAEMDEWHADCARVFDYGRKKYAEWNWAKGMKWSVPLACAVRHCLAILRGEENDPESGLPHRGHVACNIVMLAQYESSYPEGDDRPWKLLQPAETKAA